MDNLILEALNAISPSELTYSEWTQVGMALRQEGYGVEVWDEWSRNDSRYHSGECEKKWATFRGASTNVAGGTIVMMAKERGWHPAFSCEDFELGWDDSIGGEEGVLISDLSWVEGKEIHEPAEWNPVHDLIRYIETLFNSDENVGYVTTSWERDGRHMPTKGAFDRTAGELIQELNRCDGDIGAVLGDYNPEVGAWIRFNPLDGKGVKNENVTDFRYALVESDSMDLEKQHAMLRDLELPIACMVHSGGKSIHAIVKVDAATYEEYRRRVDYLYAVLKKNGMDVDTQNKNPSRLSRMPGVMRNGKKQFLMDTNIGKASFTEWKEWIEAINDDLPDFDAIADAWDHLPELAPPLIEGVLRQGHKMLVAGPSKAGKSYLLIELCIAIAEGRQWLGWPCAKGRVLYVNLELDRASCLHRFHDIYTALGWKPENLQNIDIWNLRGFSLPMDKLAPKLIRRASKRGYTAIIIDPIYKVITGDENSADQMAAFCNQFDKVCTQLGSAVIYCHHHSKGSQGGKRSMDRASGSGVFARDPDALIDIIELELTEDILGELENNAICDLCRDALRSITPRWMDFVSEDEACVAESILRACEEHLPAADMFDLQAKILQAKRNTASLTAWRVEGTLREFPKFNPINAWFRYPVHSIDRSGVLHDLVSGNSYTVNGSPWKQNFKKKTKKIETSKSINTAFEALKGTGNSVSFNDVAEYTGKSEKTIRRHVKESGKYWIDDGEFGLKL